MSRTAILVLCAAFLHGLTHAVLFAPWMGEDEPWHFEYVSHVAEGHRPTLGGGQTLTWADVEHHSLTQLQVKRRFPALSYAEIERTQEDILASMARNDFWRRVDWAEPNSAAVSFDQVAPGFTAVSQPPLYYPTVAAWLTALGAETVETRLWAARALSLLLFVATAALAWLLAVLAFEDPACRLSAVLVAVLLPASARTAALVNNDVLAAMLAAALLVLAASTLRAPDDAPARSRVLAAALIVGLSLLAVLTKMTAAGVCALALVTSLARLVRRRSIGARAGVVAGILLIGLAALLYWHVQHNPGLPRNVEAFLGRAERGISSHNLRELWEKFVGRFNWNARGFEPSTYTALGLASGAALFGALLTMLRRPRHVSHPVLLLCLSVFIVQFALIVVRGVAEGRYLTPITPAIGVIASAGLVAPWSERLRPRALAALAVLLLAYDGIYLWRGLVLNQYLALNA